MTVEKIAIITAGGSGMGAAAARRLAADGFKVAVLSSSGKGEALAQELGGFGVTGSNQSNDDLKRLVDGTLERWGRIDVLVNSAGHGPRKQILEITDEDWHAGFDTYFLNVVRPARLVAPTMQKQKGGVIINISTAWDLRRYLCGRQHPHEQRAARLDRQSPRDRGAPRRRAFEALRHLRGNRGDGCLPRFRWRGLYHWPEYPGRRRRHPRRVSP